jgi:GT2 family glycosyltransferase
MILACEPARANEALSRALALRLAGTHFLLAVYVDDARGLRARDRGIAVTQKFATWDEVRLTLEHEAADIASRRATLTDANADALIEAMRMSDGVVVRSWAEQARLLALLGTIPRQIEIAPGADPSVPAVVAGEPSDVVVYAPNERGDELAGLIVAFADLAVPVTFVARTAPRIATNARFVEPAQAADALGRARVIVDTNGDDPSTAIALAKLGRPLVVTGGSGAAEVLRDVAVYDRWNRRSTLAAVANALGGPAPQLRPAATAPAPAVREAPVFGADAPLVSIVVTTFNRQLLLAETLATIQNQTYPNIEIIVVNDAGTDCLGVVAEFPRARLINQPANAGPAAARNRGIEDARGTFVQLFDDDDKMFPDHVATLVNALLRSGLDVAYGQMLNANVTPLSDDSYRIESLTGYVALLDHADIQWAGSIATTSLMFRRSIIEQTGPVDLAIEAAEDYEFWLRLATGREWARVPEITSLYFIRNDGSNRASRRIARYHAAHTAIYAKHPSERPLVQAGRAAMLELFRR